MMTIDCQGLREQEAKQSGKLECEVHAVVVLKDDELHVYTHPNFHSREWFWKDVRTKIGLESEFVFNDWPIEPMNLEYMTRQEYSAETLKGPSGCIFVVYI